jgi:uncharacterized membrane protein
MKTIRQHLPFNLHISYFLWLGVICYSLFFSLYQIVRHQSFQTSLDLVSVEQPLWNTLHGNFLRTTYYPVTGDIVSDFPSSKFESLLGDHVQPTLLLLLPFYALVPRSETLMVILSLAVGLGAVPLFRIVQRRTGSEHWALAFALSYLVLPVIQTNTAHDIHLANFLPSLLLAAIDALDRGQIRWWWFWVLLAMGCREDVPLLVGWAMFCLAYRSRRRDAFAMLALGLVFSLISTRVIIPHFGGNSSYLARYVPLGTEISFAGLASLVQDPNFLMNELILFISYNLRLGLPFIFLYLFSPVLLLAMAPMIITNGLSWFNASSYPNLAHYSSLIIAFVLVGTVDGLVRISNSLAKKKLNYNWRGVIGTAVFTSIAVSQLLSGYTPLALNFRWPSLTGREAAQKAALAIIPENVSVSSEARLAGHLAKRLTLRFFPDLRQADWVVVDVWTGHYPYYQPMPGVMQVWQSLLSDPSWETSYASDGLIVLKRGAGPPQDIIDAFRPSSESELTPVQVHFGGEGRGINLNGLAGLRISPKLMTLCSEWEILQAGNLQPLLGFEFGNVSKIAEPLAGTGFLPSLFVKPGKVRDCTLLDTPIITKQLIKAQWTVVDGTQKLPATLITSGYDSGSNKIVDNVYHVDIQP